MGFLVNKDVNTPRPEVAGATTATGPATGAAPLNDFARQHPHLFQMAGMENRPGGFFSNMMWKAAQDMKSQGLFGDMSGGVPVALPGAAKATSTGLMPPPSHGGPMPSSFGGGAAYDGLGASPWAALMQGGAGQQNILGRMGIQF